MRAPRWMMLLAMLFGLALIASACGGEDAEDESGDAGESVETEDDATEETGEAGATDDATDATDAGETEATDAATDESTDAATDESTDEATDTAAGEDDLCTEEFAGVEAPEGFRVGLVTDIGSIDDATFNQFANDGMEAAAECFGFETDVIETASEADYQANLEAILAGEPDLVVTVGFLLADATLQFAQANPETLFVGVDQFQPEFPENYSGILFREDEGGYLVGVLAGLLTESNVIGVVAGREDVPPVVRYVNGYISGAESVNPDVSVLFVYHEAFNDPAAGRSTANQMLGEGADVIFGAGGPTGSGGVEAATETGAWGIGVDQDEYFTTFGGGSSPGAEFLATSAVKRVDLGVFQQIAAAVQDEFTGGIFTLTAENSGITYAPSHDAVIPVEMLDQLEETRAGLADGSISTGVDPATGLPE